MPYLYSLTGMVTQRDAFSLYEDEGVNYDYEKGMFSIIPISYNEEEKVLSNSPSRCRDRHLHPA